MQRRSSPGEGQSTEQAMSYLELYIPSSEKKEDVSSHHSTFVFLRCPREKLDRLLMARTTPGRRPYTKGDDYLVRLGRWLSILQLSFLSLGQRPFLLFSFLSFYGRASDVLPLPSQEW